MAAKIRSPLLAMVLVASCLLLVRGEDSPYSTTEVKLFANAYAQAGSTLRIADVASISAGSPEMRARIAKLDIGVLSSEQCRVTRREVELRCLLAGISSSQVRVTGNAELVVRRLSPGELRLDIERLLEKEIRRQFGLENDPSVRLLMEEQLQELAAEIRGRPYTAQVFLQSQMPLGRSQVSVEFLVEKGRPLAKRLDVHVVVERMVGVAVRDVPQGAVLDQSSVKIVQRPIASRLDLADPNRLVGGIASRSISRNATILASHLAPASRKAANLVSRNDLIDVVVDFGQAQVRLKNATAISSGGKGDTITVLNPSSKQRFQAVVVDSRLAAVTPLHPRSP